MHEHTYASPEELSGWFAGRIPSDWFVGAPIVTSDREEILVVGTLADPELPSDVTAETDSAERSARIEGFCEEKRKRREGCAVEDTRRLGRRIPRADDR